MDLIKQIVVTDTMLKQAQNKATEMGALNNSILKGDGNLTGFLGELIALEVLHGKQHNTYEYDIVLDNGKTVDVKSKKTKVAPKPHYECSVASFNIKQKCDLYCFVRVKDDYSCGWFLGVYPKQKYYEDAVFLRKGQVDKLNNYTVKADCYNLQIVNLLDSPE
jgi:hypothetical protein